MDHNALFLVNSVYQLLTAVHLKRTLLGDREADLLLTDVTPASALAAGAAGGDRAFCPGDSGQGGRAPGPMPPEPPGGAGRLLPEPGGPAARGPSPGSWGSTGRSTSPTSTCWPGCWPAGTTTCPAGFTGTRTGSPPMSSTTCGRTGRGQPPPPGGEDRPQGGGCPAVPAPAGPAGGRHPQLGPAQAPPGGTGRCWRCWTSSSTTGPSGTRRRCSFWSRASGRRTSRQRPGADGALPGGGGAGAGFW